MSAIITLPMWLIIVIGGLATWALLDRLLMPSMRWWVKSRANRVRVFRACPSSAPNGF